MPAVMAQAVTNGAELVKRIKATGTNDARLVVAREKLREVHAARGAVASADEVIAALEENYGPDHMTCVKARAIAERGEWAKPETSKTEVPIEDLLTGETADTRPARVVKPAEPPKKSGPPAK